MFEHNPAELDLFYTGRFDFVVCERHGRRKDLPVFAIELDGKEHFDDETVMERDRRKRKICEEHSFQLIRMENTYARRYQHIKGILLSFFR